MRVFNAGTNLDTLLEPDFCAFSSDVLGFAVCRAVAEIGASGDFPHKNLMGKTRF